MILGEANSERDWAGAKVGSNAEATFQCRVRFREGKKRENKAGYTTRFIFFKNTDFFSEPQRSYLRHGFQAQTFLVCSYFCLK